MSAPRVVGGITAPSSHGSDDGRKKSRTRSRSKKH